MKQDATNWLQTTTAAVLLRSIAAALLLGAAWGLIALDDKAQAILLTLIAVLIIRVLLLNLAEGHP